MFSAQTSEFKTHSLGMKLDRYKAHSHLEYFQHKADENASYPIPMYAPLLDTYGSESKLTSTFSQNIRKG